MQGMRGRGKRGGGRGSSRVQARLAHFGSDRMLQPSNTRTSPHLLNILALGEESAEERTGKKQEKC